MSVIRSDGTGVDPDSHRRPVGRRPPMPADRPGKLRDKAILALWDLNWPIEDIALGVRRDKMNVASRLAKLLNPGEVITADAG